MSRKIKKTATFLKKKLEDFPEEKAQIELNREPNLRKGKFWETGPLLPKLSPLPQGA